MTRIVAPQSLDQWSVASCCLPDPSAPLRVDLRRCEFIRPAGLVFLGVAMQHAQRLERGIQVELGPVRDVLKYADRMGLGDVAFRTGATGDEFPTVGHHAPDNRFVELTEFDGDGDVFTVIDDVCRTLLARSAGWNVSQQVLNNAVFEIGQNVEQHAESSGLVAVQHIPKRSCVEFAIGDVGVGIAGSLAKSGQVFQTAADAIRAAVETHASRMIDEPWRGAGLPKLRSILTGPDVRGHLIVQSGHYRVTYAYQARDPGAPSVKVKRLAYEWPGTLVFGSMNTDGGSS